MDKWPCMLAHKFSEKRATFPAAVEPKVDGVRVTFVFERGLAPVAYTRSGKVLLSLSYITDSLQQALALQQWDNVAIDGEVFCGDFTTTVSEVRRAHEQAASAVFYVFDVLALKDFAGGHSAVQWAERREWVYKLGAQSCGYAADVLHPRTRVFWLPAEYVNSADEALAVYGRYRDAGHEGAIVKDVRAEWHAKRSNGYLKLKAENTADLPVISADEGTGRLAGTLGALIVKHGDKLVHVGSGISDDERNRLWELYRKAALIGATAEVSYHEETPDGSLRHPVFKCIRFDK